MVNVDDITYEYIINTFLAYPTKDNYQDVVFSIHWELKATYVDTNDVNFITSSRYITSVDTDSITEFVPFEELTLNQTIEWINQTDNVSEYKQYLCDLINNQINPPPPTIISLPPPFSQ
jgi:hypothetical protein